MKHMRLSLSLLLCLVLVFTSSFLVASAEEIRVEEYHAYVEYFTQTSSGITLVSSIITYPNDGTLQNKDIDRPISANLIKGEQFRITYANDDSTAIFIGERETTVRLENIPMGHIEFWGEQNPYGGILNPDVYTVLVFYADGEMEYVKRTDGEGATISQNPNGRYDVAFTFTPKADVYKIETIVRADYVSTDSQGTLEGTFGEYNDTLYQMRVDQDDGTKGLLAGIVMRVKDIWIKLGEGIDTVVTWIQNLGQMIFDNFQSVLNVLNHLWDDLWTLGNSIVEWIGDKIIALFVPTEEFFEMWFDDMDDLVHYKFGFLASAVELSIDLFETIWDVQVEDSFTINAVSIPVGNGETFEFGPFTIKVVPDGFEQIAEFCRWLSLIVSVILFVNGMRKRWDEVMSR